MIVTEFLRSEIKKIAFREVKDDELLLKSGVLDSITAVDLAVSLEEKYSIKIPFTDINEQNFGSVNDIATYLESKFSLSK
jgi:acyl carrier protein